MDEQRSESLKLFLQTLDLPLPIPIFDEVLTHDSYHKINPLKTSNQRLETIGDAVIDLLAIDWLFDAFPAGNEGIYTQLRSEIVNNQTLGKIGRDLGLDHLILFGEGAKINEKQIGDSLEALFGAIFKTFGYESCQKYFEPIFRMKLKEIKAAAFIPNLKGKNEKNPKNRLLELLQKTGNQDSLSISVIDQRGAPHMREFDVQITAEYQNKQYLGFGTATTKKNAEMRAAQNILNQICGRNHE